MAQVNEAGQGRVVAHDLLEAVDVPGCQTLRVEHGVLTLRIPKAEEIKPKQIKITATSDAQPARELGGGHALDHQLAVAVIDEGACRQIGPGLFE